MTTPHWDYFLALCDDVQKTGRYVEIASENHHAFSVEFVRLLLAIGSEIDVVAKQLCIKISPSSKAANINEYRAELTAKYPAFSTVSVNISRATIALVPWVAWAKGQNPVWWQYYNNVKHQRHRYYKEANQLNTLNSLAGLFVLLGYFYAEEMDRFELTPFPDLLHFDSKYRGSVSRTIMERQYRLPGVPIPESLAIAKKR
ncbi:MAG: hypothetical protein WCO56_02210 [Verrucomicrobiota bacterium]